MTYVFPAPVTCAVCREPRDSPRFCEYCPQPLPRPASFEPCPDCEANIVDTDFTGADDRSVCDDCRDAK
jgi:hypothetical protein